MLSGGAPVVVGLGHPAQEVADHAQTAVLALLGVKLHPNDIVAPNDGRDVACIIHMRQTVRRVDHVHRIGMYEIRVIAGRDPV